MQQVFDIFGDTKHVILEYNPAGHCFVLRDLFLIVLIQISHAAGKVFVKNFNTQEYLICY